MTTTKEDSLIIRKLKLRPMHPSEISREINIPRTTIAYRLKMLEKSKIVKHKTVGRKCVWEMNFVKNNNELFSYYHGDDFENAFAECLKIKKASVVLSVQGVDAAIYELKNVSRALVFKVHRHFKKNGIVFKSITNEKALEVFRKIDKKYVASHSGRAGGLKLFKNSAFLGDGEIAVCEQFVLISNPKTKDSILIKEPGLVRTINQVFSLLFDSIENIPGINLNSYLNKITETN